MPCHKGCWSSPGQSLHHGLDWGAQQDDAVELRMEPGLVLLAGGHEQHVRGLGGQEDGDGIFPPA